MLETPQAKLEHLQALIRMLLNDLPMKRDWLDPLVERELRVAVMSKNPYDNHREILKNWVNKEKGIRRS